MELYIWHYKKNIDLIPAVESSFVFESCLRKIYLDWDRPYFDLAPTAVGAQAYLELLTVICGLDSPFLGETEVLGQFKEQAKAAPARLQILIESLCSDAKEIRTKFLKGLGPSSYGSLCRHLLEESSQMVLWGGGHLAQELAPWLRDLSQEFQWVSRTARPELGVKEWKSFEQRGYYDLVVAAPVSDLHLNLKGNELSWRRVLDFRADSAFRGPAEKIWNFSQLKEIAESYHRQHKEIAKLALGHAQGKAEKWAKVFRSRPQGWEDLCVGY